MAVDFKLLKQLREETGVSFSVCKKALEETDNNMSQAKAKLTEWGAKKSAEKADREAGEGGIFSYVHHNKKIAGLVELRSETDFVSGNEEFRKLGDEIAMQVASTRPASIEALLEEPYIRDAGKTIGQLIQDSVLKFGENVKIHRILRWELGE